MDERTYGDIICKYPELIESGLTLVGREVYVYGKRIDLLFKDEFDKDFIVELKIVPIRYEHVGQIVVYNGALNNKGSRLMLISPVVSPHFRNALDAAGIGWKEITFESMRKLLEKKDDHTWDEILSTEHPPQQDEEQNIITPFNNSINFNNHFANIRIIDNNNLINRYNINAQNAVQEINIQTTAHMARMYYRIEEILHQNNFFLSTHLINTQSNWGFSKSFQEVNENNPTFYPRVFWINFNGHNPKSIQLRIHRTYIHSFQNPNIPKEEINFFNGIGGRYLVISDYLTENTLEEIMNIIVSLDI